MTDHYAQQREADEVWKKSPRKATHYADGKFWMFCPVYKGWMVWVGVRWYEYVGSETPADFEDFSVRPQDDTKPSPITQDAPKPQNPYQRTIIGLDGSKCVCDVYRVLDAFKTDSPALDHAVKKILCPGTRHQKDREQDLREAIKSIEAELLLMSQR